MISSDVPLRERGGHPTQYMSQGNSYRLSLSSSRMRCLPRVITIANPTGDAALISIFWPAGSREDDGLVFFLSLSRYSLSLRLSFLSIFFFFSFVHCQLGVPRCQHKCLAPLTGLRTRLLISRCAARRCRTALELKSLGEEGVRIVMI